MPDEELASKMIAKFPQYKDQVETPGFFSKVGNDLKERGSSVVQTIKDVADRKINPASAGLQVAGAAAGALGDVIGQGLSSVASAVVPESVKEAGSKFASDVLQTDLGKKGIEMAKMGMDKYDAFKSVHPEIAKDLESAVNIAQFIPAYKGAEMAASAVESGVKKVAASEAAQTVKTLATEGKDAVKKNIAQRAKDKLVQYVMPALGTDEATKAAERGALKDATLFNGAKITPQAADHAIADAVTGVVNPSRSLSSNIGALKTHIKTVAEERLIPLLKASKAVYNENELKGALSKVLDDMPKAFASDEAQAKTYQQVVDIMLEQAKQRPAKTTLELWRARSAFDDAVEAQLGSSILSDGGRITARKEAVRRVRDVVNGIIGAKSDSPTFNEYMSLLSKSYQAKDNLVEKQAMELLGKRGPMSKGKAAQWMSENPIKAKFAGTAAAVAGGAAGVSGLRSGQ